MGHNHSRYPQVRYSKSATLATQANISEKKLEKQINTLEKTLASVDKESGDAVILKSQIQECETLLSTLQRARLRLLCRESRNVQCMILSTVSSIYEELNSMDLSDIKTKSQILEKLIVEEGLRDEVYAPNLPS